MGKKRIIQKTEEELLRERERVEAGLRKEPKLKTHPLTKEGQIFISSTYNNTIMALCDLQGNVLNWQSAGSIGFKGTKKATPFAASKVAEAIFSSCQKLKLERVKILVRGIGTGRDSAIRSLVAKGLDIVSIKDITPIPHNGCRPAKARRV